MSDPLFKAFINGQWVLNKAIGRKIPQPPELDFDPAMVKFAANGQWSIQKSGYGPKGKSQYNPTVNIKRKAKNVGDIEELGVSQRVKSYTPNLRGPAAKQADAEAKRMRRKSKKQPVLHLKGAEAAKYLASKKRQA